MTPIEQIKAEIKWRKAEAELARSKAEGVSSLTYNMHLAEENLCMFLLSFIESLEKASAHEIDFASKGFDEAAEDFGKRQGIELAPFARKFFKAGAVFGAKKMLAKLKENCVIIDKDLYEAAMEGRFIEGREEGKKWMAGQGVTVKGLLYGGSLGISDIPKEFYTNKAEEVIVQIRKK